MTFSFRLLSAHEGSAFRSLRLKALESDSEAFLADLKSEQLKDVLRFSRELVLAHVQPPFGYYGCFADDQLVGYVQIATSSLSKQRHLAFLYNLYFDPEFRGKGLAGKLLKHIQQILKTCNVEKIVASCIASNQSALHFYQQSGFIQCGRRPGTVKWNDHYTDEIELILAV